MLDSSKSWEPAGEVSVALMNVLYLSAGGGRGFRNIILTICNAGRNDNRIVAVDMRRKTTRQITPRGGRTTAATVDYAGKYVIVQGGLGSCNGPTRIEKMSPNLCKFAISGGVRQ